MVVLKNLNGNDYVKRKLKEAIKDERLFKLSCVVRELNRHDFDRLFLQYSSISQPPEEWQQFYKDIVDKLIKIHVPTTYGKAIQIDYENLIELPAEDRNKIQVLIFDYIENKLQITDIHPANNFKVDELLALVGRHPFKDILGWTVCQVKFSDELHEVIGISQHTWKMRGGDFDGDDVLVILMKLPEQLHKQLKPEIKKAEYKTNEIITLPTKMSKATISKEINNITIPDFEFTYCKQGRCLIYPETISHIQNLENLHGAILMAINIATSFNIRWDKNTLITATKHIINELKRELEEAGHKLSSKQYQQLKTIIEEIHPTFYMILTPILAIDNIDIDLYQATLRIFLKDKGPAIFGYIQKQLLSVAETREEIEQALNYVDQKQQQVIDLKKAENS